ncbi:hypothetical protein LVW35_17240 [Pseudomonas sp. HN11]|uniref:hypothetical protein n=1 Tax=Pseudomonas sp. HN11 TaxID=1344094 RepID=UPI001F3497AF|nr:hypothetical protein [Pseudomonas sp. HN11]UII69423.1 hypothetical protein LVW35_17240 [Pseudomonas sp. HN11]
MNGILVSRSTLLPAPSIVPSSNNVISRAVVAGNKARLCIPLYAGIKAGDVVDAEVATDGQWIFFGQEVVTSIDIMIEFKLFDALFASPATTATASYSVNNGNRSELAVYTIED